MKSHTMLLAIAIVTILLSGCGNKPPVGAEVRYGLLSDSVLQLYNSSHERMNIQVTFTAKNGVDRVRRSFQIAPLSRIEIGALECPWNFEAGETAVIHVDGYGQDLHVKLSQDGKSYETWYR